jgi:hypothetical protein
VIRLFDSVPEFRRFGLQLFIRQLAHLIGVAFHPIGNLINPAQFSSIAFNPLFQYVRH